MGKRGDGAIRIFPSIRHPGNTQTYGAGAMASPGADGATDEMVILEVREASEWYGSQGQPS